MAALATNLVRARDTVRGIGIDQIDGKLRTYHYNCNGAISLGAHGLVRCDCDDDYWGMWTALFTPTFNLDLYPKTSLTPWISYWTGFSEDKIEFKIEY